MQNDTMCQGCINFRDNKEKRRLASAKKAKELKAKPWTENKWKVGRSHATHFYRRRFEEDHLRYNLKRRDEQAQAIDDLDTDLEVPPTVEQEIAPTDPCPDCKYIMKACRCDDA